MLTRQFPPQAIDAGRSLPSAGPWMGTAWLLIACALIGAAIADVSLTRPYPEVGVETDFAGSFARDAARILDGRAPFLQYHPPAYSMALAAGTLLAGDMFAAALWISGLSAIVMFAAGAFTFRRLVSPAAAWGVVVACACSVPFWTNASLASTDMPFAALVTATLALLVEACRRQHRRWWALAGAVAAITVLCRTNGLPCALVVLAPLFQRSPSRSGVGAALCGFMTPMLCWTAYAVAVDAPLFPARAHVNLAVAAYGGTGDAEEVKAFNDSFDGTFAILTHDPWRLTKNITSRLFELPFRTASTLTWKIVSALALVGFALLLRRHRSRELLLCLTIVGLTVVLTGLHPYLDRFFLFLLPWLGALAGLAVVTGLQSLARHDWIDKLPYAAVSILVMLGGWRAYTAAAIPSDTVVQTELREAVPVVHRIVEEGALLYSRKPFLGFAVGIERRRYLPEVTTPEELLAVIETHRSAREPAYVFIGSVERKHRPELSANLAIRAPLAGFEPVARGERAEWTLYRAAVVAATARSH